MKDGSFLNMDFKDGSFGAGWMDGLAAVPTGSVGSGIDGMGGPSGLGSMLYGAGGQGGDDMILNGGVMMPNEGEMVYADSGQYPGYANAYNQYEPRLGRKPKGKPKGKPKNSPKGKIHRKKGMEDYIGGQNRLAAVPTGSVGSGIDEFPSIVPSPNRSKGQWSDNEDDIIKEYVKQKLLITGAKQFSNWTELASHLTDRGYERLGKQGEWRRAKQAA